MIQTTVNNRMLLLDEWTKYVATVMPRNLKRNLLGCNIGVDKLNFHLCSYHLYV